MQVMIHFHLTPPLMFQYAPQLLTVYSTTIMLVLCITALWISGDIDALHQLSLVTYIKQHKMAEWSKGFGRSKYSEEDDGLNHKRVCL